LNRETLEISLVFAAELEFGVAIEFQEVLAVSV
jgi:hypothetical protein